MRVRGNAIPEIVEITEYEPIPGKDEVRIRENIQSTANNSNAYEYDEYTFILDHEIGMATSIREHLDEWLATGRTVEVSEEATLYVTAKADAIDEYTTQLIEEGLL